MQQRKIRLISEDGEQFYNETVHLDAIREGEACEYVDSSFSYLFSFP